jgi:glycosyltransferase involved in cell wall biosynthesis
MSPEGRVVAIAFHEVAVGGASRSILRILPLLQERGWAFTCWTPGPGPLRDELEARGHPVAGAPRPLRYHWRTLRTPPGAARRLAATPGYLRAFRAWVRHQAPALMHANTLLMLPEASAARRGRRVVLYAHETVPDGLRGTLVAGLSRYCADVVVGISDAATAALRRRGIDPRVVPNGVPLPTEPPAGRDGGPLVVGTIGTVSKRKGSDVFLAAVQRLRSELPEAEFRMIGPPVEGPDRPWADLVMEGARRAGVRLGERPEPYPELREWDIAVVPSRDEPFGLVAAEAMAVGLPVVATRAGGLPEVVGSDAGLIVEPDDPQALARAIVALARDPARRAACGAAGRSRVESRFTLEAQAEGVHSAYLSALAGAGGPSA